MRTVILAFLFLFAQVLRADQRTALNLIDDLAAGLENSRFFSVKATDFVRQLKERVQQPYALDQGKTKFCWIAAPCALAYDRHPEEMVRAMFQLYTTGTFRYSSAKRELKIRPRDGERLAVGTCVLDCKNDSLAGKPVDQMLFMTFASRFKCALNIDRRYHAGDENRAVWAGATLRKEKKVLSAFGYKVDRHGYGMAWWKKNKATEIKKAIDRDKAVILFVNASSFNKKLDKVRQMKQRFPFIITGSHYVLLLKLEAHGDREYKITFWDDDGVQERCFSHDLFQQSVFGMAAMSEQES